MPLDKGALLACPMSMLAGKSPRVNPIVEYEHVTAERFAREIQPAGEPAVLRGLVAEWPIVCAARQGDEACAGYLQAMAGSKPLQIVIGAAALAGRMHLDAALRGPNFEQRDGSLADFLALLLQEANAPQPRTIAAQGLSAADYFPDFSASNAMPFTPPTVLPRFWIGNAIKVAIHHDPLENIACVAAGRRRFTLFPPEAVGSLYMGPFHLTPAGTPVSMVHLTDPDLERYPRFGEALEMATVAELEPGDAIYIPYQYYHHVESLSNFNILVNYWWDDARKDIGSPWDAMMHGLMTLRNLPPAQRRAWKAMFDHYVFLTGADPAAHIPRHAQGVLGATSPQEIAKMRALLMRNLHQDSTR